MSTPAEQVHITCYDFYKWLMNENISSLLGTDSTLPASDYRQAKFLMLIWKELIDNKVDVVALNPPLSTVREFLKKPCHILLSLGMAEFPNCLLSGSYFIKMIGIYLDLIDYVYSHDPEDFLTEYEKRECSKEELVEQVEKLKAVLPKEKAKLTEYYIEKLNDPVITTYINTELTDNLTQSPTVQVSQGDYDNLQEQNNSLQEQIKLLCSQLAAKEKEIADKNQQLATIEKEDKQTAEEINTCFEEKDQKIAELEAKIAELRKENSEQREDYLSLLQKDIGEVQHFDTI